MAESIVRAAFVAESALELDCGFVAGVRRCLQSCICTHNHADQWHQVQADMRTEEGVAENTLFTHNASIKLDASVCASNLLGFFVAAYCHPLKIYSHADSLGSQAQAESASSSECLAIGSGSGTEVPLVSAESDY